MKITFLTPHINISGGVKIILEYANKLVQRGHKVTIICPMSNFSKTEAINIPTLFLKKNILNFFKYKPHWIKVIADIIFTPSYSEKYIPDADIIVATAWQTASYVRDYSFKKGKKFYLIQHYESLYHGDKKKVDETYFYPIKKIVVSSWLKKILIKKFKSNIELIINPIDLEMFYPAERFYKKKKIICMLYHHYKWKGIQDGLDAIEIARKTYPDIGLIMFGTQPAPKGIVCEYYYKPFNDRLREIYNSADIYLCTSWHEGFGLPAAEAMACKCALVTTNTMGNCDYAINEKTALVSPPKDVKALSDNLIRILSDEELFLRIMQNGYQHIQQFSWENAVEKIEKIFVGD